MEGNWIKAVTPAELQEALAGEKPVLVCFLSEWSAPCRELWPHLEALADRAYDRLRVVSLDPDLAPLDALRWDVNSIPTVLLFRGGALLDRQVGVRTLEELTAILDKKLTD